MTLGHVHRCIGTCIERIEADISGQQTGQTLTDSDAETGALVPKAEALHLTLQSFSHLQSHIRLAAREQRCELLTADTPEQIAALRTADTDALREATTRDDFSVRARRSIAMVSRAIASALRLNAATFSGTIRDSST